jgi:hypothetical protein
MNHLYKGKAKYILTGALVLLFAGITLYGSNSSFTSTYFSSTLTNDSSLLHKRLFTKNVIDTPPTKLPDSNFAKKKIGDSLLTVDTTVVVIDTILFKTSKDSLDAPVSYHADDSMVLDVPTNKIILYGKETKVEYIGKCVFCKRYYRQSYFVSYIYSGRFFNH